MKLQKKIFFFDEVPLKGYVASLFLDLVPEIKEKVLWKYPVTNDFYIP